MPHTIREKEKLLNRVRRIRGQVEGIERALDQGKDCTQVLQTVTACRGAINSLMAEIIEGHIHEHVLDSEKPVSPAQRDAAQQLVEVVKAYLK
jgi:DNA-binding FrmR family transcriptional regulator